MQETLILVLFLSLVCEADQAMPIEPNRVYIIPPNKFLAVSRGMLQLSKPPEPRSGQTSIDFFFRSLGEDLRERAIAIIFSGTGSHGTQGLKEVKIFGGMVMVQEPDSAEHDQMPRNAIASAKSITS